LRKVMVIVLMQLPVLFKKWQVFMLLINLDNKEKILLFIVI
jgi:hypothetical protein